jgi:lysophospholipid acyltransferase (LPLAT)-like uncharacterized protein
MYLFRHRKIVVMISKSRDGSLATDIAKKWGYEVVGGSSSRGKFLALKKILQKKNYPLTFGMALDGPRGPALVEKPGASWLASKLEIPLIHLEFEYHQKITLKTWDKCTLPLPFSVIEVKVR